MQFNSGDGFCEIINGNTLTVRDCSNDLLYFQDSLPFVALTCPVSLTCEEHTSAYKLWMFPFPITVNQQCMKQSHLPRSLPPFYCHTHF